MELSVIEGFSSKELETFKSVCNHLLGYTFVVRTLYRPDGGTMTNPEYTFLARYSETVGSYLAMLDWELLQDEYNGYFYVLNTLEVNRCTLNKTTTAILLTLRMIYDEDRERAGLSMDVLCTVRDLLEKLVTTFGVFKQKPNMDEIRRSLKQLEAHSIVIRLDGKYSDVACSFTILPTIMTAVSAEKMQVLVREMQTEDEGGEEANEEADQDFAD